MLVCDASLAVELALDRVGEDAAATLGDEGLVAPPLLWSEVPSVLHELVFRDEISQALGDQALNRFTTGTLAIKEQRPAGLASEAWRIATELGWAKTYDAEYLATARLLKCRLVTFDMRLRRGAERLDLVVTPAELAGEEQAET